MVPSAQIKSSVSKMHIASESTENKKTCLVTQLSENDTGLKIKKSLQKSKV